MGVLTGGILAMEMRTFYDSDTGHLRGDDEWGWLIRSGGISCDGQEVAHWLYYNQKEGWVECVFFSNGQPVRDDDGRVVTYRRHGLVGRRYINLPRIELMCLDGQML